MADTEDPKPTPEIPVQEGHVTPITVAREVEEQVTETEIPVPVVEEPRKVEKLPDWAQKTIKDTAFEAREANRRAKAAEAELATLKAPKVNAADEAAAREAAPSGGFATKEDFDAAVQAEANRRTMQDRTQSQSREFGTKLDEVWTKGIETFKDDFGTIAENLNAVGLLPIADEATGTYANDAFMRLVMATDHPAEILYAYGGDPRLARELMDLSPEKRAIEIGKMDAQVAKKAPAPLSKVPRPVETVEGSARVSEDPRDDDSDEVWFAKREKQKAAQRG